MKVALKFWYRNWRGEKDQRSVIPSRVYFGVTEHHTAPQWLMEAFDVEKSAMRTFAMKNIWDMQPGEIPCPEPEW